tara:strand:- start:2467 stop:2961 length:495 start_codon:yes stop_codon:yes gene_type:complete
MKPLISIIVAMDKNNLIGCKNKIPWHIPSELKRFRSLTMGKPIVMGRKTHESIGRILDGRDNIILSLDDKYSKQGIIIYNNLNKVIEDFSSHEEIIIIGGSEIYKLALPLVKKLYITYVDGSYSGDTWFPNFNLNQWSLESSEDLECPKSNITYASKIYSRINE